MKNQCPNKAAWGKKATGGGFNRGGNSGGNGAGKRSRSFFSLQEVFFLQRTTDKSTIFFLLRVKETDQLRFFLLYFGRTGRPISWSFFPILNGRT
jgi:hypothetical protein